MALSKKHQDFINEYFLQNMNGTDAYQAVYPKASRESARREASRLLTNVDIQAEISERLKEKQMSADEVLTRLAEQARADMADFVRFQDGIKTPFLDLESANNKGLLWLVKKFKYNAAGHPEIELYDAQAALVHLGKAHGLFNNDAGSSEDKPLYISVKDWQQRQNQLTENVNSTMEDFEDAPIETS